MESGNLMVYGPLYTKGEWESVLDWAGSRTIDILMLDYNHNKRRASLDLRMLVIKFLFFFLLEI